MYTIRQAAARTGIPVALLRAWEARYGIVTPRRTAAGYRLYDEAAIEQLRAMRGLVDGGWSPSVAAAAILAGEVPSAPAPPATAPVHGTSTPPTGDDRARRLEAFEEAAIALDSTRLEHVLDEMFAAGSFEQVAEDELMPALTALGQAWSGGRLGVGGEHAASQAVQRRLAAAYQAAGRPSSTIGPVLVGLPPGSRHELGALAFAVAARRAGLPVLYLGPDLPVRDWVAAAIDTNAQAAVVGSPTRSDRAAAADVAGALRTERPALPIALGGRWGHGALARVAGDDSGSVGSVLVLPDGLVEAVDALASLIGPVAAV
jgi:MerR family transcriptional regulator, light-induced transcriptional regulator